MNDAKTTDYSDGFLAKPLPGRAKPRCVPPPEHAAHPLHWIECAASFPMVMLWRDGGWYMPNDERKFLPDVAGPYRGWRYLAPAHPPEAARG